MSIIREDIKIHGVDRVLLGVGYDDLIEAIANLQDLRDMLVVKLIREGTGDPKQRVQDAHDMEHDFNVAVQAMTMLAVNMEENNDN